MSAICSALVQFSAFLSSLSRMNLGKRKPIPLPPSILPIAPYSYNSYKIIIVILMKVNKYLMYTTLR